MTVLQVPKITTAKIGADPQSVQRALSDVSRAFDRTAREDVICESERRLVLRSPDGHYWSLTMTNAGALVTADMGTSL